tara:strand:+ start:600 stop:863 length:264 start_codon:yes stop_codon:yes gene_type:complete
MKYKTRVKKSAQEVEQSQLDHDVAQSKLQIQADLLATKLALSKEEAKLEKLKSARPFSLADVVSQTQVVNDYKDGLTVAEAIVTELF